jgi:uncharacterized protein YdeI (YjbR/CyaY-like superfamily)
MKRVKKADMEVPVLSFKSADKLRAWLVKNHRTSDGIWVKLYKKDSGVPSVTFEQVLDEGLCFGWSESSRRKADSQSYLQRFTPRRTRGTTSQRNREHLARLIREGRMTNFGLEVLDP